MKKVLVLFFLLLNVVLIRPDAAAIQAEAQAITETFLINVESAVSDMILVYLNRGKSYTTGLQYFKGKIIDRMFKMHGTNIYAARQLLKTYLSAKAKLDTYFQYDSMRSGFSGFDGIPPVIVSLFNGKLDGFINSADPAVVEACWSSQGSGLVQTFFDDTLADFVTEFTNAPTLIDANITFVEDQRLAMFQSYENVFKLKKYVWNRISAHVSTFFNFHIFNKFLIVCRPKCEKRNCFRIQ